MDQTPRPSMAEMSGLTLAPLKRKTSLSNLSPLRVGNTSEKKQLTRLGALRLYLLENLGNDISKESLLEIFEGDEENLRKGLNTVYYEGDEFCTVFYEYVVKLTNTSNAKNYINNLELLISLGTDINKCTTKTGKCEEGDFRSDNALLYAMAKGHLDLVHYLASKGGKTFGNMPGAIGHHGLNVQEKIKNAFRRGAAGMEGSSRKKRKINRRKTRTYKSRQ